MFPVIQLKKKKKATFSNIIYPPPLIRHLMSLEGNETKNFKLSKCSHNLQMRIMKTVEKDMRKIKHASSK